MSRSDKPAEKSPAGKTPDDSTPAPGDDGSSGQGGSASCSWIKSPMGSLMDAGSSSW